MSETLPSIVRPKELDAVNIPVVDEEGKEIVRPDVIQAVVQLASLGQLARIRKSLEKEEFVGRQYSRTLSATASPNVVDLIREEPFTALASATFLNDGDDAVYIGINERRGYHKIESLENYVADYTKADTRIELIHYWCDVGEAASVRIVGKY